MTLRGNSLPQAAAGDGACASGGSADPFAGRDWNAVHGELDQQGWSVLPGLLDRPQCEKLVALYAEPTRFRKRIVMQNHGYGRGEYQYFSYPLPSPIEALRVSAYAALVPLANRWNEQMGLAVRYPTTHAEFLARCHAAGQTRPTPLLLAYGPGDFNCLHQDLYGEHLFPLQLAILLSAPGEDFGGGEFVMTEQRARQQSRPMVLPLRQGDAAVFAVHQRPVASARGYSRVTLRHGVSQLSQGRRHTAGIIFHDAQ